MVNFIIQIDIFYIIYLLSLALLAIILITALGDFIILYKRVTENTNNKVYFSAEEQDSNKYDVYAVVELPDDAPFLVKLLFFKDSFKVNDGFDIVFPNKIVFNDFINQFKTLGEIKKYMKEEQNKHKNKFIQNVNR